MNLLEILEELPKLVEIEGIVIGIDGDAGVGKSTLARLFAARAKMHVVHIDEFLKPGQGTVVGAVDYEALLAAMITRPVVVEGVCLLEVLQTVGIKPHVLFYLDRPSDGNASQSFLEGELDRYKATFHPIARADVRLRLKSKEVREKEMNAHASVDVAYIRAKTFISITLAVGGMLAIACGLLVLLYGVASPNETLVKVVGLEVSAKGLGGVIMASSVVWAFFAYRARPIYAIRTETVRKADAESSAFEEVQRIESTMISARRRDV